MRSRGGRRLVWAIAVLTAAGVTAAQGQAGSPPCVLDRCMGEGGAPPIGAAPRPDLPPAPASSPADTVQRAPLSPGDFDFYVLALSWSPAFCDTGGAARSPDQCAAGRNPGFVVHGLWPQNQHGYPADCDAGARFPSRAAMDQARDLYPDAGLARHEWGQHGTCSGLAPAAYFAAVRQARSAVAIPPALRSPAEPQTVAPLAIARAFATANPGLRPDAVAVTCRRGELAEVRICFAKDLRSFVSCPEVTREDCRTRAVLVPTEP